MPAWTLRPALPADVETIAELKAVVLRADLERLGRYDEHRVRQRVRDRFSPAFTSIILVDGAFAGSVALRPDGDRHWLEHFYLAPQNQGHGIGSAVLTAVLPPGVVSLDVLQGSPARRLYERHGFTVDSQNPIDVFMSRR